MHNKILLALLLLVTGGSSGAATPADMVVVGGGVYEPLFADSLSPVSDVQVESFYLDRLLVSNADYLEFITDYPKWGKSETPSLFADDQYLKHFPDEAETVVEAGHLNQPVTNVSWFAARAYCQAQQKRLPTVDEWEYAARASATEVDATHSSEHRSRILDWYGSIATDSLPDVSQTPINVWGVRGMHGVVWELVSDFNSVLVTGESRGDSQLDRSLFCGAGAASSSNPEDYAAFMRYALRSSYQANYTLQSLGFRCARSLTPVHTTE